MNIFITGTDTDIGKTIVSAWICKNSKAGYWKPIQTGIDSDSETIAKFSPNTHIHPNAYRLNAPLSPYNAAKLERRIVDIDLIKQNCPTNNTIIEGAGGVLVPISDDFVMADLIKALNAKAIIVAKSKLGFLNHILLTVESLRRRSVEILGIVLNGNTNLISTIETFSKCKVLATLRDLTSISSVRLPNEIIEELK